MTCHQRMVSDSGVDDDTLIGFNDLTISSGQHEGRSLGEAGKRESRKRVGCG